MPQDLIPDINISELFERALKDKTKILAYLSDFFEDIGADFLNIRLYSEEVEVSERSMVQSADPLSPTGYRLSYQELAYAFRALSDTILMDLASHPDANSLSTIIVHPNRLFGKRPHEFVREKMIYVILLALSESIRSKYAINIQFYSGEARTEVQITVQKSLSD